MTSTVPRVEEQRFEIVARRNRAPIIVIIVLGLAALGFGGWLLYDQATQSALPEDIERLLDDYLQAWEERDADAVRATAALDFVINEYWYEAAADRVFTTEVITDNIEGLVATGFNPTRQWQVEWVGEPILTGEGPWFVSVGENWIRDQYRGDGIASYVIVEENGLLKIANHYWAGEGIRTSSLTP